MMSSADAYPEPDQKPSRGDNSGGLTQWFIRNPVAANLLMIVLLIGGAMSASSLRSEVFPTISPGIVTVTAPFPGATPAEVEEGITRRVEEAVLGIDGVKRVSSRASENVGVITVEAADFVEIRRLKDDIEAAVGRLAQFPPENAEKPIVVAPEPTGDVVTLVVMGELEPLALKRAAEAIERDLLSHPGITLVSLAGDRDYEISIEIPEHTLREYGMTIAEVANAIRASSLDLAAGAIAAPGGEILLRTNERRQTGDAFRSIEVRSRADGSTLLLGDIATIRDGFARSEVNNTYNGKPAIFIQISRAAAEDVIKVKRAVDDFLQTFTPPPGVEVRELRDQTLLLQERVNLLARNALFGFALVFLFLVLMLDLKLACWVSVGIATAFLGGFLLFGALGVTITMISLFGLIIVLGLVVDDAVVIGESIDAERAAGFNGQEATIRGVRSVAAPVLVGVATTMCAFAPLLLTGGAFADIARAIPLVVICVLIVSIIEALFILPSHLSHGQLWSRGVLKWMQDRIAGGIRVIGRDVVYPGVKLAVRRRGVTAVLASGFFAFAIWLAATGTVRFVFFPDIEGNDISASVTMPEGSPFDRTAEAVRQMEAAALRVAERMKADTGENLFRNITATAGGRTNGGGGPGGQSSFTTAENVGQVQIELTPFGERRMTAAEIERLWRTETGPIEGAESVTFNSAFAGFGSDIAFELAHTNEEMLLAAVSAFRERLTGIAGVNQIEDSFDFGKTQFVFTLKPQGQAAGLRPADVARQLRQAFFGEEVQRIQRGREEIRVYVRYPEAARSSLSSLGTLRIALPGGGTAPLESVATIEESRAYSSITRIDGRRVVNVTAEVDESISTPALANAAIVADLMPGLERDFPGLRWVQAGAARQQAEDFASLGQAFVIVIIIIYGLLASQLKSYVQPLAILLAIPLSIAGAILGHLVLGYALSFVSMFGMVALAGVAVNASVVLIDQFNRNVEQGINAAEACAQAAVRRFRPIVITTLTTALGLAPLLAEPSPQAQFLVPMAVSLGFGIVVSGFMVIFVTPAIAVLIEDIKHRKSSRVMMPAQ